MGPPARLTASGSSCLRVFFFQAEDGIRDRGVTVFLTTHRLEEAERLCHRIAILNTTLRIVGAPAELRHRLFSSALEVRTTAPLENPDAVFRAVPGADAWRSLGEASYRVNSRD